MLHVDPISNASAVFCSKIGASAIIFITFVEITITLHNYVENRS